MKVLITGGSGLLGKSLVETQPEGVEIVTTRNNNGNCGATYRLDVRDKHDTEYMFSDVKPDVVIHCAAIGSVDYAEEHFSEVYGTNMVGTKNITDIAKRYGAKVVYISTNAVYSGVNPPYDEQSPLMPINKYGKIKMMAETYVTSEANNWLIVRPFLLYGWPCEGGRQNWAVTIVKRLSSGLALKLVNDYYWMPTYAPDCARTIWRLLDVGQNEAFNVASPERVTLYEFGLKVCEVFDLDSSLIEPVDSNAFPGLAPRPEDTTYSLTKLDKLGIILSDVTSGLIEMRENGA